ncbi:ABC transporter permease subunit, partial [Devosia sp.]|uniref:ABC transporter permease subunit n=1 Tax=Devosia sp. TaxID=1871048 RepID=UPI002F07FE6F
ESLPRGQTEAATALGMQYWARIRHVILPQALRITMPATTGYLIQLIKGTSLAGIIGLTELTRSGQIITNATYQPMIVYAIVAALYFLICWPLSLFEARLAHRGERPTPSGSSS